MGRLLDRYKNRPDGLILALPRGGVPIAFEVARALELPMDIFVVRKLRVPGHEELAMGAVASGGIRIFNSSVIHEFNIPPSAIDAALARETDELERRERLYRGDKPTPKISGHTVIIVDDGLATGSTMRAAIAALRRQDPVKIVVAVPIAADQTCNELRNEADAVVCAVTPQRFYAVGSWYEDFNQISDSEVAALIHTVA